MTTDVHQPASDAPSIGPPASLSRPVESTVGAMEEYRARQAAELAKLARLRELRLGAEAQAGKAKAKWKPPGKGKR